MPYDESWDRPHTPGTDPLWQESDCYWFHDHASGVGGYHRIGQHPSTRRGQVLLFTYQDGGQRFKLSRDDYAATELQRDGSGQRVGNSYAHSLGNGAMRFGWNERESAATLEFHDVFYEPRSWRRGEDVDPKAGSVKRAMNDGGHLEVSGRLRGHVRIGSDTIPIDALAHRDRSWGRRDYQAAYQHRMLTGTVGAELSWATYIMHLANGVVAKAGFIARHGETIDVDDVRIIAGFDYDGLTVAGVEALLRLSNGETLALSGNAVQGFAMVTDRWLLSSHHFVELDHHGASGFTILDATNRPSRGDFVPVQAELSMICMDSGVGAAMPYSALHSRR